LYATPREEYSSPSERRLLQRKKAEKKKFKASVQAGEKKKGKKGMPKKFEEARKENHRIDGKHIDRGGENGLLGLPTCAGWPSTKNLARLNSQKGDWGKGGINNFEQESE